MRLIYKDPLTAAVKHHHWRMVLFNQGLCLDICNFRIYDDARLVGVAANHESALYSSVR